MKQLVNRLVPSSSFDLLRQFAKLSREVPYEKKILWNVFAYSGYAYGLLNGCKLAKKLGIHHIAAVELGVAGGNGLLALEKHGRRIEKITGVKVSIYGFDTGEGLLDPMDHKDMPYFFSRGNFRMREDLLRDRLEGADLTIGDVCETFPEFLRSESAPPIAFIAFDMDYYHPTRFVLDCMAGQDERSFLPRTYLFFDNTVGNSDTMYSEFAGELLAIAEANEQSASCKIALDRSFRSFNLNFAWYHKIYILHRFKHPMYGTNIGNQSEDSLSLKAG